MGKTHSIPSQSPPPLQSEEPKHQKRINFLTEIAFLQAHSDIVRQLARIDHKRFASAGDDGVICVWDSISGLLIQRLVGHTLGVSALLSLDGHTLVSGSNDHSVRFWDLLTSQCITRNAHSSRIQCLSTFDPGAADLVSVGTDRRLCFWERNGNAKGMIELTSFDNLRCVLSIGPNLLVLSGENSLGASSLFICHWQQQPAGESSQTYSSFMLPSCHRQSVDFLSRLTCNSFASASSDGCIAVWLVSGHTQVAPIPSSASSTSMPSTPLTQRPSIATARAPVSLVRTLNYHEQYLDKKTRHFPFQVTSLCVWHRCLFAAVGENIHIYDLANEGDLMLTHPSGCVCSIVHMFTLYRGGVLVTVALDSTVRIWYVRLPALVPPSQPTSPLSSHSTAVTPSLHRVEVSLQLIEEMKVHSDSILCTLKLHEDCFATAGVDQSVVLWKDQRSSAAVRTILATHCLRREQSILSKLKEPNAAVNELSSPNPIDEEPFQFSHNNNNNNNNDTLFEPSESSASIVASPATETKQPIRPVATRIHQGVPLELLERAETLREQNKLSIDEISFSMRADGVPDEIIAKLTDMLRDSLAL